MVTLHGGVAPSSPSDTLLLLLLVWIAVTPANECRQSPSRTFAVDVDKAGDPHDKQQGPVGAEVEPERNGLEVRHEQAERVAQADDPAHTG